MNERILVTLSHGAKMTIRAKFYFYGIPCPTFHTNQSLPFLRSFLRSYILSFILHLLSPITHYEICVWTYLLSWFFVCTFTILQFKSLKLEFIHEYMLSLFLKHDQAWNHVIISYFMNLEQLVKLNRNLIKDICYTWC